MYQELYDRTKKIIKNVARMRFHNVSRALYLENDASVVSLGVGLLKLGDSMKSGCDEVPDIAKLHLIAFASKNLSSTEQR